MAVSSVAFDEWLRWIAPTMEHQKHWCDHEWPVSLPRWPTLHNCFIQRQLSLSTAEPFLGELHTSFLFKRVSLLYNGKIHFVLSAFRNNERKHCVCTLTVCVYCILLCCGGGVVGRWLSTLLQVGVSWLGCEPNVSHLLCVLFTMSVFTSSLHFAVVSSLS